MKKVFLPEDWYRHIFPLSVTLTAAIVLILAPFWAVQWLKLPFIGMFFEPNNVARLLESDNWPPELQRVREFDQLTAINNRPVTNARERNAALAQNGFSPVSLTFASQDGESYQIIVTPWRFSGFELVNWFGVPYLVGVAFLLIGLWAYRLGWQRRSGRAFLIFTAAFSITTATYFDMNTFQYFVLGWVLSIPIVAGGLAHLALAFPREMVFVQRYPVMRVLPWLITLGLAIPTVREILAPTGPWEYITSWVWGYGYGALAILLFLGTLLLRVFKDESAMVRQQSRIIVFGAALAFGPIVVMFLLPTIFGQLVQFPVAIAFPMMVFLPLSAAYAIVRYRMLDVDRFLGNTLTYALTATGAVMLFYILIAIIQFLIPTSVKPDDPILIALYLFILVLALNPLRDLMSEAIDRIFYRTRADYRRVLTRLSQELGISPEMQHTLKMLEQELNAALAPERIMLFLYDDDDAVYRQHGEFDTSGFILPSESPLIEFLNPASGAVWFPPERSFPQELSDQNELLDQMACRLFVPLRYEGRLIGILALGERRSGEPYTSDDLEFLNAVAGQSSLALENVRLFANLQETLNQTLEMKNLMDDIFQSMSSGVITTDLQRKITLFNQAAERILGTPVDRVIGVPLSKALSILGPRFSLITNATIDHGTPTLGEELTPTIPQRGPLFLRLSWTPLLDAQQGTKGATIVIDDLTEQRQLRAEQERIRQTFGRVVAPRVRDRLLEDPSALRLDGIRQPLTVLFADIHQFTPFSERTQPEDLFGILNSYLSLAAQAVLEEEGTLDKFMGDAVMAFWNAPDCQEDHVLRAARAALAMDKAIRAHRTNMSEEYKLFFSIGINVGDAMVGNVGTTDLFNYTAIGDTVNYAQRLESIAKPGQILLSEAAYCEIAKHIIVNELPPVTVKGKSLPAVVYELLGLKDNV
jgi:PAS domain S-box-containing protein